MKIPHLNLYSRFFLLFTVTTLLLVVCIILGSFAISEEEAKQIVQDRHEALSEMLTQIISAPIDIEALKLEAKKNRVAIQITKGEDIWRTGTELPELSTLQKNATPLGNLNFSKAGSKYFIFVTSKDTTIAVTSTIANLIVYPDWLTIWPWVAALFVLFVSYKLLNNQLKPVRHAIDSAVEISNGNLAYRIVQHPKNDLGKLTQGLNDMAESLEQLFASKNELLLSVSHELRSPMARMKVLLALIGKNETATKLNTEIDKMNDIVEQLLESERLRDSHKLLNLETYFLPNVLNGIIGSFADAEALRIEGNIPEVAVEIDLGRFKFLVKNLIENALKYAGNSSPVIITCQKHSSELTIGVRDFGPGIEAKHLSKIFEPFSQATEVENRGNHGLGLGLFLCKRIANAHGGDLTVNSEPGKGSEFTFRLPIIVQG